MMTKISRRQAIIICGFLLAFLCSFLPGWYFWTSAGDSEDQTGTLLAMAESKLQQHPVVKIGGRKDLLLIASPNEKSSLDAHMRSLGWIQFGQMGANIYYQKGPQIVKASTRPMTGFFRIATISAFH